MGDKSRRQGALFCAMLLALCSCASERQRTAQVVNGNAAFAQNVNQRSDSAQFDAAIERLEKEATINPGDDDIRLALSRAYLARANARREAGQLREALKDYSTALRYDPDNGDAQRAVVSVMDQLQRERGAAAREGDVPEQLPITPDVMVGDDNATPNQKEHRKERR